jgi:alkylation response protein AidB-like acyl-CoA dehydrogenase
MMAAEHDRRAPAHLLLGAPEGSGQALRSRGRDGQDAGRRVAWAAQPTTRCRSTAATAFALEYPISRVLCDARILNIFEGAGEVQAMVIARRNPFALTNPSFCMMATSPLAPCAKCMAIS